MHAESTLQDADVRNSAMEWFSGSERQGSYQPNQSNQRAAVRRDTVTARIKAPVPQATLNRAFTSSVIELLWCHIIFQPLWYNIENVVRKYDDLEYT